MAGRGGGVALPGLGSGGRGRGTGIALKKAPPPTSPKPQVPLSPKPKPPVSPKPNAAKLAAVGRGGGIAAPKAAGRPMPKGPGAPAVPAKPGSLGGGGTMPRKFKVPEAPAAMKTQQTEDARMAKKVRRPHIPQYDKRKWNTAQSLFYPYDKIKRDFELQGLFTRMKDKAWMAIYYDMILMYLPTKEGPPSMDDKLEGRPFGYFFLDNIVDSDKIGKDPNKMVITLPTQNSKDDLKIVCDTQTQFKEWLTTITELSRMFERTPRDGIESKDKVEEHVAVIQKDLPMGVEVPSENIDQTKAGDWLLEMRKMSDLHRKHIPYIDRIERFSAYRVGHIAVYCNFFQGRDRDGPSEMLIKAKKKVLGYWESEVERILKLCEDVLAEDAIDKDHLPCHMEDCQIAAFYIDLTNAYSTVVHGVAPSKLVLQKSLQRLEETWQRLSKAKTKDN